jgi:RNA polymerase sigma factor (sigma-70 family)
MEKMLEIRAVKGDEQAILQLLEQDEEILYRTAFAYVQNEQDALDAMQELTYKTFKKIHTVKEPAYVRTWLMRVLINCCLDICKKRQKKIVEPESFVTHDTLNLEIQQILSTLSLSEQQLIYMKYFQEMKNKEIAQIHQIPEGTVKSKLHTILRKLRKQAGERGDWL